MRCAEIPLKYAHYSTKDPSLIATNSRDLLPFSASSNRVPRVCNCNLAIHIQVMISCEERMAVSGAKERIDGPRPHLSNRKGMPQCICSTSFKSVK